MIPAASANMVLSLASSADVDQYTKNISAVTSQMQTADSALSAVVTSLNTAVTLGTSGAGGILSTANKQAVATQVQGVLANVVSQANASYQGAYLFGGSVTTGPPILPASTTFTSAQGTMAPPLVVTLPLTAGSVTTISDAATGKTFVFTVAAGQTIASLSTAVANAAAAGILSAGTTATINATGQLAISSNSSSAGVVASSNDPVLGAMTATPGTEVPNAYAYVGNSTVNSVPVGDSLNVATNLPGSQIFTSGANVIGSLNGAHHRPPERDVDTNRSSNQRCFHGTGRCRRAARSPGQQHQPVELPGELSRPGNVVADNPADFAGRS